MKETDYDAPNFGDEIDKAILMHREAHFGGNFALMIDYYQREGRGASLEFDIPRVISLAEQELQSGKNLAVEYLSSRDAEEIVRAKEAYKKLREIYTSKKTKSPYPLLIANLILTEDEMPEKEIEAIVKEKSAIVPFLINLVRSEDMYNPLFPGYGKAPYLAAECLGKIGDKRAIISLFETIGHGDFFDDDIALSALHAIGEPAKKFLLTVLHGQPITEDNERAAIALLTFRNDPEVAKRFFDFLKNIDLKKNLSLATYLILGCEFLNKDDQTAFIAFANHPSTPKELKNDFESIIHLF